MVGARCDGAVLVIEARLSVNLNALTIEQVTGKRLKLLTDMASNMEAEVRAGLGGSGFEGVGPSLLRSELRRDGGALSHAAAWFNDDDHFEDAARAVVGAKRSVLDPESMLRLLRAHAAVAAHVGAIEPLLDAKERPVRELAFELLLSTGETAHGLRERGHEVFTPDDWREGGRAEWELEMHVHFLGNGDRADRLALSDDGAVAVCCGGQRHFEPEEAMAEAEIKAQVEAVVELLTTTGRALGAHQHHPLVEAAKTRGLTLDVTTGEWHTRDGRAGTTHPFAVTTAAPPADQRADAQPKHVVSIVHLKTAESNHGVPRVSRLEGHAARTTAVAVDGDRVASADEWGNVVVWSLGSGEKLQGIKVTNSTLFGLALQGDMLFAGGRFAPIFVWYVGPERRAALPGKLRNEHEPLMGHGSEICSLAAVGGLLVSGSADGTARLWTLADDGMTHAECTRVLEHAQPDGTTATGGLGVRHAVNCVRINDGRVATACSDAHVRVWSAADGTLLHKCQHGEYTDHIDVGSVSLMGALLVSGGHAHNDKSVKVWNLNGETPECVATLQRAGGSLGAGHRVRAGGHRKEIIGVAISSHGTLVSLGQEADGMRLWRCG